MLFPVVRLKLNILSVFGASVVVCSLRQYRFFDKRSDASAEAKWLTADNITAIIHTFNCSFLFTS